MKTLTTINPYNQEELQTYILHTSQEIEQKLEAANSCFRKWRKEPLAKRTELLDNLEKVMERKKEELAMLMTLEMGKPITQSITEIDKCIWLCSYYAEHAAGFLEDKHITTDAKESFVRYDPIGAVLAVMPWNYPFWQVMRFAIPTLTAGNTGILKHASNVTGCALAIEALFAEAGYPNNCFTTLIAEHEQFENIIQHQAIKAVTLTGSEKAGKSIAAVSGGHLKKTVLELGGNNACIVWDDADLETYIPIMVQARMQNTGQSCIAAKRFIVVEAIYDDFVQKFVEEVQKINIGSPTEPTTTLSVLARTDLADTVEKQVATSLKMGAKVLYGNKRDKAYYDPTVICDVTEGMPLYDEEVFGPVAAIIEVKDEKESMAVAATSPYGLGTMVFTEDIKKAKAYIEDVEDGAYFINEMVKSDPRLPFGGTKLSGYGRELSKDGILEFVNKKTVYVK